MERLLWIVLIIILCGIIVFLASPYKLLIVRSDSMVPQIPTGSIVVAERVEDASLLSIGDVITYRRPGTFFTVTHRIIDVTESGYMMKGDNLREADGEIQGAWILYKVKGCWISGDGL